MSPLLKSLSGDPEIEALMSDEATIAHMIRFERALAMAEGELSMIPEDHARRIHLELKDFVPDMAQLAAGMERDGVVVPELVRQMRAVLGEAGASLHRGTTSQDVIDSAMAMQIVSVMPVFASRIDRLLTGFDALAARHHGQELQAHTRMQKALPISVAVKVKSWRAPLRRAGAVLAEAGRELTVVQLGGPVGDGASFKGNDRLLAEQLGPRLGLGVAPPWHSERDRIAGFAAELAKVSGVLGKFGTDISLMAQGDRGEVRVEEAGISSAIADKANPVAAEVLVALARFNAGSLGTLHQALVHENESSGAAWTLEWLVLPQMILTTGASLRLAQRLLDRISF
ncbi:3-carboxy-cis,cis-muconate cycloisomerase [Cereibacter sp. SYSU M97828]|nr:3-carboxy-cis,cis-muconate cycloisomerase [Cereibacter flavus]